MHKQKGGRFMKKTNTQIIISVINLMLGISLTIFGYGDYFINKESIGILYLAGGLMFLAAGIIGLVIKRK